MWLGLVEVNVHDTVTMESVERYHLNVRAGGRWNPVRCSAWQKLAVIISFRDRLQQLPLLLNRLHTLLQRQMMYYQIFVVEQVLFSDFWAYFLLLFQNRFLLFSCSGGTFDFTFFNMMWQKMLVIKYTMTTSHSGYPYASCQTWPLSLLVGCCRPDVHPLSFVLLLSHKAGSFFFVPWRVESWVNLGTVVLVCSPSPKLYIGVVSNS